MPVLAVSLSAHEPPEARGLTRDGVRLMVSRVEDDSVGHARFRHFPDFLASGDVVVVNTSATINACASQNDKKIFRNRLFIASRFSPFREDAPECNRLRAPS